MDIFSLTARECLDLAIPRVIVVDKTFRIVFALVLDSNLNAFQYKLYSLSGLCDIYYTPEEYQVSLYKSNSTIECNETVDDCNANVTQIIGIPDEETFLGSMRIPSNAIQAEKCVFNYCSLVCRISIARTISDFEVETDGGRRMLASGEKTKYHISSKWIILLCWQCRWKKAIREI